MNSPIRLAQVSGQTGAAAIKVVKLEKPAGGQAVTIELSYDQSIKVDFTGIGNERIVIVRIGERAVILFDNGSTITLDPFFDSLHRPLKNLQFEFAGGVVLTGEQIATFVPFTDDQSILPAAGEGGDPREAGADFNPAIVEAILAPPLNELMPPEFLPPIEFVANEAPASDPTLPTIDDQDPVFLDEDGPPPLPGGLAGGPGDANDPTIVNGELNYNFGSSGPHPTTPITFDTDALNALGLTSGTVLLVWTWDNGTQTLTATAGPAGPVILTLVITDVEDGTYTLTLSGPLDHPSQDDPNTPQVETSFEDEIFLELPFEIQAASGATDDGLLPVTIDDDSPVTTSDSTNYIHNGSFAQGDWSFPDWWGSQTGAGGVPGWSLVGTNTQNFERPPAGYLNLTPSSGAFMLDMGGSPGNQTISQSIGSTPGSPTLTNGVQYVLELEVGAPFPGTALLEVYWNGQLVGTIDTAVFNGTMDKYAFIVEGTGNPATDVITFKEVGTDTNTPVPGTWEGHSLQTEGYHGTYIANVKMFALNGVVDEDGLNNANADGIGNDVPSGSIGDAPGNNVSVTGNLGVQWGADLLDVADAGGVQDGVDGVPGLSLRNLTFASASVGVIGVNTLTSNHDPVSTALIAEGTQLVGYVESGDNDGYQESEDRLVFDVTLSDDGSGSFTFTLHDNLDHAPGADENDIALKFDYVAEDSDGDQAPGSFVVGVDDDLPVQNGEAKPIAASVKEDGMSLAGDPGDPDLSEGNRSGGETVDSDETSSDAFGSIASLFEAGADSPLTFKINSDLTQLPTLLSKGEAVTYGVVINDGGTPDDPSDDVSTLTATAGARTVFTLTVNGDGTWTFDLDDQLDHVDANGDAGFMLKTSLGDVVGIPSIDFSSIIVATDDDGDPAVGAAQGSFTVAIENDVPILKDVAPEVKTVDEDDIRTPWSTGTSPNTSLEGGGDQSVTENVPGDVDPAIVSGELSSLVQVGADESLKYAFTADAIAYMQSLGLFSKQTALPENGLELTYAITTSGNNVILTATEPDQGGNPPDSSNPVFTLTLNTLTGHYDFRLFDELIHVAPPAGTSAENLELRSGGPGSNDPVQTPISGINFGKIITVTDFDNDPVSLDGRFIIQIKDDVPYAEIKVRHDDSIIHDETEKDDGADDADFDDLPSAARQAFEDLFDTGTTGNDPHADNSDLNAIGFATDDDLLQIDDDTEVGADHPPLAYAFSLAIDGGDGTDSGLDTTEGVSIILYKEGDLIVGRVGSQAGLAAFAIHIDDDGEISVAQWLSIKHDDVNDHDESNDPVDNGPVDDAALQQTLAGKIKAILTVTDSDGDTATDEADIGHKIIFEDDGPDVKVDREKGDHHDDKVELGKLTLDESHGLDAGDSNAEDDDVAAAPTLTTVVNSALAIGVVSTPSSASSNVSIADLFDEDVDGGVDGIKSVVRDYTLTLRNNSGSVVTDGSTSGVKTNLVVTDLDGTALETDSVDARTVWLFKQADGSILGIIGKNSSGTDTGADGANEDNIAFRIYLDETNPADPIMRIEQYLPIEHPDGGSNHDDSELLLFLDEDASLGITYTVTATDGDDDFDSDSETVLIVDGKHESIIKIEDDGPKIVGTTPPTRTVDEDDIVTSLSTGTEPNDGAGDGSTTGNPDQATGPATITGSLAGFVDFGMDGPHDTTPFSFISESNLRTILTNLGLKSKGENLRFDLDGNVLQGFTGGGNNEYDGGSERLVFKLTLNPDGTYTFELHDQLDHDAPNDDAPNDNVSSTPGADQNFDLQDSLGGDVTFIDFGQVIQAMDGDDDTTALTGKLKIEIKDDVLEVGGQACALVGEDAISTGDPVTTHKIFFSISGDGEITGVPDFDDEDVIERDVDAATYELFFNGSAEGLGASGVDIDALHVFDDGTFVFSLESSISNLDGVSSNDFDDDDLILWNGTGFELYQALPNLADENIDAISIMADGDIIFSISNATGTVGSGPGTINFADEDLIRWDSDTNTYSLFFDGSANGLSASDVDIDALHVFEDGTFVFSLLSAINNLGGNAANDFDDDDLILWNGSSYSLYSSLPNLGDENIDAISIRSTTTTPVTPATATIDAAALVTAEGADDDVTFGVNVFAPTDFGSINDDDGNPVSISSDGTTITGTANGETVFTVTVNATTGEVTFSLFKELEHGDLDILELDFGQYIYAKDFDNDRVYFGQGNIKFKVEDGNEPLVLTGFTGLVEEEHQLAGGIDDLTSTPDGDGNVNTRDGDEDTGPGAGLNLTTNVDGVDLNTLITSGLDGSATFGFLVAPGTVVTFAPVDGGGNVTSGGQPVRLVAVGSTLYGFADNGATPTTYDAGTDRLVFEVTLTGGNLLFTLHDRIDHHATGDGVEGIKAIDLSGFVTVTDSAEPETAAFQNLFIKVIDDKPEVDINQSTVGAKSHLALELDETVQPNGGDVDGYDRYNTALDPDEVESTPSPANGGADDVDPDADDNIYNQPIVSLVPTHEQAFGSLSTAPGKIDDLFTPSSFAGAYGADGAHATTPLDQTLSFVLSGDAVQTTLIATELEGTALDGLNEAARTIYLYAVGVNGDTIEGRIGGADGPGGDTSDEYVVFRIVLTDTGDPATSFITVDQFLPIDHAPGLADDAVETPSIFDENAALALVGNGTLGLKLDVTLMDGDGDTDSDSATVILADSQGSFLSFDDDGPTIANEVVEDILDDEIQDTSVTPGVDALGIEGGPGDDGGFLSVNGSFNFTSGSDGLKSIAAGTAVLANGLPLQAIHIDPVTGQGTPMAVTSTWAPSGAGGTLTGFIDLGGTPDVYDAGIDDLAYTLVIQPNGSYVFTQHAPLAHSVEDDPETPEPETEFEDNLSVVFNISVTDGDGDVANATLSLNVDDDTPDAAPQAIEVSNDPTDPVITGLLNFKPGADGWSYASLANNVAPEGVTSGGQQIHYFVDPSTPNVLIAYTGALAPDADGYDSANTVFILTVNPGVDSGDLNDGVGGNYTLDMVKPLDGVDGQILPIGGSTSFGSGPTTSHVLTTGTDGTGQPLAVLTGWNATGINVATWQSTGNAGAIVQAQVNGSEQGWGVAPGNTFEGADFFRFDFQDDDFTGSTFSGPAVTSVEFDLLNFGGGDHTVKYVVHFTDGSAVAFGDIDFNGGDTTWEFVAPDGKFIDYVELYANGEGGGPKIDLVNVGVLTDGNDIDLSFNLDLADGDDDVEQVVLAVTVIDENDPPQANDDEGTVVEAGYVPNAAYTAGNHPAAFTANTPDAGDNSAGGNVLTNDTDPDGIPPDTQTVVGVQVGDVAGPIVGGVGATIVGTYGSVTIAADGTWTYTLNNLDVDTNALAEGAVVSEIFSYTMQDADGATSTAQLEIDVTGTNDSPAIALRTLTFDEFPLANGGENALNNLNANYGGFTWSQVGVHDPDGGLGYVAYSGENVAFFAEANGSEVGPDYPALAGSPLVISRDMTDDFNPIGAWFSSAVVDNLPITITAFDNGVQTGQIIVLMSTDGPFFVDFTQFVGFSSIDRLEMDAPAYFGFDDFMYSLDSGYYAGTFVDSAPTPVVLAANLQIADPDSGATINGAQVVLTNYFLNDALFFDLGDLPGGVTATGPTLVGDDLILTFTGNASAAAYEALLQSVTYSTSNPDPDQTTRLIEFRVIDNHNNVSNVQTVQVGVVDDDFPQLVQAQNVALDEDGFAFANADLPNPPFEVAGNGLLVNTGTVTIDFADEAPVGLANLLAAFSFINPALLNGQLLALDGDPVTFALDGADLVGTTDGGANEVIRIEVINAVDNGSGVVTYTYQVTLSEPVKHDDNGLDNENLETLSGVQFQVSDVDGDPLPAPGSFNVTILDDVPEIDVKSKVGADTSGLGLNADETDDAAGTDRYNPVGPEATDNANPDGNEGAAGLGTVTSTVSGGLLALFDNTSDDGADGPASPTAGTLKFLFQGGSPLATTLTATDGGAIELVLSPDGQTITGRDTADSSTVFTIAIVDVGGGVLQVRLTQNEAIDHDAAPGSDEATDLFDEVALLLLSNVGSVVYLQREQSITDLDGDTASDSLLFPFITSSNTYVLFDDDGPKALTDDDTNTHSQANDPLAVVINGDIPFSIGSDGQADVGNISVTTNPAALKVGGVDLQYSFDPATNTLTAYTVSAADPAFTLVVNPGTQTYVFDLIKTLDGLAPTMDIDFTVRIVDGDGDGINFPISIDITSPGPSLGVAYGGTVEEEHLRPAVTPNPESIPVTAVGNEDAGSVGGIDLDTDPNPATSGEGGENFNVTTHQVTNGSFNVTGGSGPLDYSFNAAIQNTQAQVVGGGGMTSGGLPVYYHISGNVLIGYVNSGAVNGYQEADTEVFTLRINQTSGVDNGTYTFTLYDNIDHHPIVSADHVENFVQLQLNNVVQVTDGVNPTLGVQGAISIIDDIAIAKNDTAEVQEGSQPTLNAVIVLDLSASMEWGLNNSSNAAYADSRLKLMQDAVTNLLSNSDVTFNEIIIYTFENNGILQGVFNVTNFGADFVADAITEVNSYDFDDLVTATNFDEGAQDIVNTFPGFTTPASQTNLYWLTDVDTSVGFTQLDGPTAGAWADFLEDDGIDQVIAVGFSGNANPSDLGLIAPRAGDEAVIIEEPTDLSATLEGTLPGFAEGNVLLGDNNAVGGGDDDSFGADGGQILSIEVGVITYTYNTTTGDITASSGPNPTQDTPILSVATPGQGGNPGHLTFNFLTGAWEYEGPAGGVTSDLTETFDYVLRDGDGDLAGATLSVTVLDVPEPNVAPKLALDTTHNVRDEFEATQYGNNNGSANWAGNWDEDSDDDSASGSDIQIVADGDGALRFGNGGTAQIERVVNLTGATSATLSFDYRQVGLEDGDDLRVFISSDGINFDELLEIDGNSSSSYTAFGPLDISAYISATTTLRFEVDDFGSSEFAYIDNVNIAFTTPTGNHTATFTEGGAGVAMAAANSLITDSNDTNMESGSIVLTNKQTGDQFSIGGSPVSNGSAGSVGAINYAVTDNGATITIALTGSATKAAYEAFIKSVTFANSSDSPSTNPRIVQVTVNDGEDNSNTATTTITVVDVNENPTATDNTLASVTEAQVDTATSGAPFALGNVITGGTPDSDPDGGTLTVSAVTTPTLSEADPNLQLDAVTVLAAQAGERARFQIRIDNDGAADQDAILVVDIDGDVKIWADGSEDPFRGLGVGESATINFGYTLSDGQGGTDTADVSFTVNGSNDAPVANSDNLISNWGGTSFTVPEWAFLLNDTDPDGDSLDIFDVDGDSDFTNLDHAAGTGTDGTVTIDDNGTAGGTFDYVITDGTTTVAGNITYTQDTSGTLSGSEGADIIVGNTGDSTIDGNGGRDVMFGGGGADIFDFNSTADSGNTLATADIIADWSSNDTIDLVDIDAVAGGSNQAFLGVSNNVNTVNNSVTWYEDGGNTIVQLDTNGTAGPEMMFILTGVGHGLTASDFNL